MKHVLAGIRGIKSAKFETPVLDVIAWLHGFDG